MEDDGRGFAVADSGDGLGLTAMQDCAGAVGGVCTVRSTPGVGTVVTATLPTDDLVRLRAPMGAARRSPSRRQLGYAGGRLSNSSRARSVALTRAWMPCSPVSPSS